MNERIIDIQNIGKEINCEMLLQKLPSLVREKHGSAGTCIVCISGASAAGKSTISNFLESNIQGSRVLNMDDYLKGWGIGLLNHDSGDPDKPYFAGLNPGVYDLDKLFHDVLALKQGKPIDKPTFDELRKEPNGTKVFEPPEILILEGIYSLESPFLETGDIPVLVEASLHDRLVRKIVRNSILYKQNVDGIITTYLTNDEPTYPFYRGKLRDKARLIVNNPLNPVRDFEGYRGMEIYTDNNGAHTISPKTGYGSLHLGEQVKITDSDNGMAYLQYVVGNKMLINAPIRPETVKLIGDYYNFE